MVEPFLFAEERLLDSWKATYLPSREAFGKPPAGLAASWFDALRWLAGEGSWMLRGALWLTSRRVIFQTDGHPKNPLEGSFSLFHCRMTTPYHASSLVLGHERQQFLHTGSTTLEPTAHDFLFQEIFSNRRPLSLQAYLAVHEEEEGPAEQREVFLRDVVEHWWKAGCGLLSAKNKAWLDGMSPPLGTATTFREGGEEPQDFRLLQQRFMGIEGEGLAQLRWLFAAEKPSTRELYRLRSMEEQRHQWEVAEKAPPRRGRLLWVQGEARQSEAFLRKDWR